jgi:hypothetical protein
MGSSAAKEVFDVSIVKVTSLLGCAPAENRLAAVGVGDNKASRTWKAMETNCLDGMKINPEVEHPMAADLVWGCIATCHKDFLCLFVLVFYETFLYPNLL